jgi:hypothetical protein
MASIFCRNDSVARGYQSAVHSQTLPTMLCRPYLFCGERGVRLAQKKHVGGHAFRWEYSHKRLKLAQLLGQPGVFLTCGPYASTGAVILNPSSSVLIVGKAPCLAVNSFSFPPCIQCSNLLYKFHRSHRCKVHRNHRNGVPWHPLP